MVLNSDNMDYKKLKFEENNINLTFFYYTIYL